MVPDASGVGDGNSPVYITKPITLELAKLRAFLQKKDVQLPRELSDLLDDSTLACNAFYYQKDGPLLMMFSLEFKKGLISSLTGDPDIQDLNELRKRGEVGNFLQGASAILLVAGAITAGVGGFMLLGSGPGPAAPSAAVVPVEGGWVVSVGGALP